MYIQEKAQKLLNKFEFANVWRKGGNYYEKHNDK